MDLTPNTIQTMLAADRTAEAERQCRDAVSRNRDDGVAWFGLALVAEKRGDTAGRIDALQNAIRILGEQPPLLGPLADAFAEAGKLKDAKRLYRKLADAMPDNPLPLVRLADCLARSGDAAEAKTVLQKRLTQSPEQQGLHGALNQLLLEAGEGAAAVAMLKKATDAQPGRADLWVNLGHALKNTGALDRAADAYRKALDGQPLIGEAYRHLMRLDPTPSPEGLDGRMETVFADASVKSNDRAEIGFGLFHLYDRQGRHDDAWAVLDAANALMRQTVPYRADYDAAYTDTILNMVTEDYIKQRSGAGSDERPIFIVGLPRTGSTLVEQILSSHPDVAPIGESTGFDEALSAVLAERAGVSGPAALDNLNAAGFTAIADRYWRATAPLRGDAPRQTDKQLGNIRIAGLVRLAFPNAAIVLCERDEAESLFSSYSMAFSAGQAQSYSLDDLVSAYKQYHALVDHWDRVLGEGWCLRLSYESLIGDFEAEARKLVAACGLDWSDACLDFHKQKNVVRTASAPQVRQKPYKSSLQRSLPYRQWLDPYLEKITRAES
ncbi:MAG: sulfotransferase [Alphaproteobacteria bacterium]